MCQRTFESALARIDEISECLTSSETSLEDAVALYKEAGELLVHCHSLLGQAKLQIDEVQVDPDDEF